MKRLRTMQLRRTEEFAVWLSGLRDKQGRAKILARIDRLEDGNPGKTRSVGAGVVEMKIDFGPGYRVYYIQRGRLLILLLCGGDKSTQSNDIQHAKALAAEWTGTEN
ncbi:MAG: type II toxin-antitoxin system RelE/ParE family toxin [Terracidiphilus sp.]